MDGGATYSVDLPRGGTRQTFGFSLGYSSDDGGVHFVLAVSPDGEAARCDVHAGDRILAVNAEPTAGKSHADIVALLCQAQTAVNLTLARRIGEIDEPDQQASDKAMKYIPHSTEMTPSQSSGLASSSSHSLTSSASGAGNWQPSSSASAKQLEDELHGDSTTDDDGGLTLGLPTKKTGVSTPSAGAPTPPRTSTPTASSSPPTAIPTRMASADEADSLYVVITIDGLGDANSVAEDCGGGRYRVKLTRIALDAPIFDASGRFNAKTVPIENGVNLSQKLGHQPLCILAVNNTSMKDKTVDEVKEAMKRESSMVLLVCLASEVASVTSAEERFPASEMDVPCHARVSLHMGKVKNLHHLHCQVFLTPTCIHIYDLEHRGRHFEFPLEPLFKLRVDKSQDKSHRETITVRNGNNDTFEIVADAQRETKALGLIHHRHISSVDDTQRWHHALLLVKNWMGSSRIPLPALLTASPMKYKVMVQRIFGELGTSSNRLLWHSYLAHPRRAYAVNRIIELCTLYAGQQQTNDTWAEEIFFALELIARNEKLRCLLLGCDWSRELVDKIVTNAQPPHGAAATNALRIFLQALEQLLLDVKGSARGTWLDYAAKLLGYSHLRADESSYTLENELRFYELQNTTGAKKRPLLRFTYEEMHYLKQVATFRYLTAEHYIFHCIDGQDAFLEMLRETRNEEELRDLLEVEVPGSKGRKTLAILTLAVHMTSPQQQREAFKLLQDCWAVYDESFACLRDDCLGRQRLHQLVYVCRRYIQPSQVPKAVVLILEPIIRQGSTIGPDVADLLLEGACFLLGSETSLADANQQFFRQLEAAPWHPEVTELLERKLRHFVTHRFLQLTRSTVDSSDAQPLSLTPSPDKGQGHRKKKTPQQQDDDEVEAMHGKVRTLVELESLIIGLIHLCRSSKLHNLDAVQVWGHYLNDTNAYQNCLMERVRTEIARAVSLLQPDTVPIVSKLIREKKLANHPGFFSAAMLDAVSLKNPIGKPCVIEEQHYCLLLQAADKLDTYESFDLSSLPYREGDWATIRTVLDPLCNNLLGRKDDQLEATRRQLTISALTKCSLDATDGLLTLSDKDSRKRLWNLINHYMVNCKPELWPGHFEGLDAIAFFLKYCLRESFELAWKAFKEVNQQGAEKAASIPPWIEYLLHEAQQHYTAPLVDPALLTDGSYDPAALINRVRSKAEHAVNDPEARFLSRFTAAWMQHTQHFSDCIMLPHNTQIITMLMFSACYRACYKADGMDRVGADELRRRFKALVAEVGTGEGKSVIIVMLALYFVVEQGRRVHVLENNASLRDRDVESYIDIYNEFKVKVSTDLNDNSSDVIYCLQSDLQTKYLAAPTESNPLANIVLIVDEVDGLIFDQDNATMYVKRDEENGVAAQKAFELLRDKGAKSVRPSDIPATAWNYAFQGYTEAIRMVEGKDYVLLGDRYRLVDKKGRGGVNEHGTSAALVYINWVKDKDPRTSMSTPFIVVSTPNLFRQYAFICGVTGTVGGAAEKDYLEETYRAGVFAAPAFLQTCSGVNRRPAGFIVTAVESEKNAQMRSVLKLAAEKSAEVPVLVICATPTEAESFYCELVKMNGMAERAQLFLQHMDGRTLTSDKCKQIVIKSTAPVGQPQAWRVTVTDYFGGRGQDYKIRNETVDQAGGLLVIMTQIPDSQREWVQWKGRTARQVGLGMRLVMTLA